MLVALWRESPVPFLAEGERLATMASLLHVDHAGASFAGALMRESGEEPTVWLRRHLDAYLLPVLHSFYAYDLAFMPHGENVILVLDERGRVVRAICKGIAEEIVVMDPDAVLPLAVERVRAEIPEDMKLLSVFTDVFDCFFRFLAATLAAEGVLDEDDFWRTVAECVRGYQEEHPEFAARFERYDMFAETFALSALNRLQLVGDLPNPITRFARPYDRHEPRRRRSSAGARVVPCRGPADQWIRSRPQPPTGQPATWFRKAGSTTGSGEEAQPSSQGSPRLSVLPHSPSGP